jgi:S1-C subfamily serine protease
MNLFDLGAICLLIAAIWAGIRSGALPQLGGLIGAIAGGAVAVLVAPLLADQLDTLEGPARAIVVILGILLLVGLGEAIGAGLGRAVSGSLGTGFFGTVDRVGGGLIGIAQAILIVWLVGGLVALAPFRTFASQAQQSTAVRIVTAALPPIGDVASDVGKLIDSSGLPEVFVGGEPSPAPPVATPDEVRARAIAAPAIDSTAAIESEACGYSLTGTGFVVGRGYLVTNAHVVAGAERTSVAIDGVTVPATVVLFDPDLDVALLHAPDVRATPLRFAVASPARGTEAAALGHPGGGPLVVLPAAVTDVYRAEGRDLSGSRPVTRNIVELTAAIDRGDSGGPLILPDGTVGGLVFAESRTDPSVGYALAPTDVATAISPALGRVAAVSTGGCLR